MEILDKIKNAGRRMVGQGIEVDFGNRIQDLEKTGIARNMAEVYAFNDIADNIRRFTSANNPNYNELNMLQAALNETFGGNPPATSFRNIPITTPTADMLKTEKYILKEHELDSVSNLTVKHMANNIWLIRQLAHRFQSELTSRGITDINDILSTYPEMGADLTMIVQLKNGLQLHESQLRKEGRYIKNVKNLKNDTHQALGNAVFKGVPQFVKTVHNTATGKKDFGSFLSGATSIAGLTGKLAWGAGKLAFKAGRAGMSALKK